MIAGRETFRLAALALRRNKLRSFLTALGIIIGVAAVICMVSIGEGAKSRIRGMIESAGTNVLLVMSGSSSSGGMRGGMGSQPTITWEDLRALQTELPLVRAASPQPRINSEVVAESATWSTTIYGTLPEYFVIRSWAVAQGATFTDSDQAGGAKNAVIGQSTAEKLFGAGVDPVGQVVRIRNAPFTIIGVLEKKGQSGMGQDQDDGVFVPLSAFQARMQRGLGKFVPGPIYVSAVASDSIDLAKDSIAQLLRDRIGSWPVKKTISRS